MPFMDSIERIGYEKGIEKGVVKGEIQNLRANILDILTARFGNVSPETASQVASISDVVVLKSMLISAATATSMDAFC